MGKLRLISPGAENIAEAVAISVPLKVKICELINRLLPPDGVKRYASFWAVQEPAFLDGAAKPRVLVQSCMPMMAMFPLKLQNGLLST